MKLPVPFLLLLCAVPGQATITFFGAASSPADYGSQAGSTVAVTPPASMLAGDLAVLIAQNRDSALSNVRLLEPGGQGWSFPQEFTDNTGGFGGPATAVVGRVFWCTFNGTWSANPSITLTNGAVTPLTVVMVVFRPTTSSKFWVGDVGPNFGNFAAPATPFTVTGTGLTTGAASTVTLALWAVPASNTWGTLSGSGWSQIGLSTQNRNINGSGQSISIAYNIRTTAGAVANVSRNESAGTAGSTFIMSLAEVDLPTGGGAGSIGGIQTASFQEESAASTVAATFASAVGSGHAVVGMAYYETAAAASYPVNITDNQGNSYTILSRISNTEFAQDQLVFFLPNITNGPTTVTLTISNCEITHGIILREVDNINAFDKYGNIDQISGDAFNPQTISTIPALTPSSSNAYIFGSAHLPGNVENNPFYTVAAGWTKVTEIGGNPTGHPNAMIAERILGSPSSLQFTWTIDLGRDASAIMAAFAPAAMNTAATSTEVTSLRGQSHSRPLF